MIMRPVRPGGWSPLYPRERYFQTWKEVVQFRNKANRVQRETATVSECVASIPLSTVIILNLLHIDCEFSINIFNLLHTKCEFRIKILNLLHTKCEFRIQRIQLVRFPT